MIDKLKQIEDKLIMDLLSKPEIWNSLVLDSTLPLKERLWTQIGNYRISLDFIHTCKKEEVFLEKNIHPNSIHILQGGYEMGVSLLDNEKDIIFTAFAPDGNLYYDSINDNTCFYIRPTSAVCSAVMLSGELFEKDTIKENKEVNNLDATRKSVMLEYFLNYYRNLYRNIRLKENLTIQRGDWVEFDKKLMTENDKKGFHKYLNMRGYVIKRVDSFIDARFENDRVQANAGFLKKLFVETQKPIEKNEPFKQDMDDEDDEDPDFL